MLALYKHLAGLGQVRSAECEPNSSDSKDDGNSHLEPSSTPSAFGIMMKGDKA